MDDTFWLSMGAADIADGLITEGSQPFLMVMPFEVDNFDPPTESKFGDSIINELIPWVEENYSVCTERACRAVGGISRGGGWALRPAMRNFDTLAQWGLTRRSNGGRLVEAQKHSKRIPRGISAHLYRPRGRRFSKTGYRFIRKVLYTNGIPHEFIITRLHNKAYWQEHVADYLRWYAEVQKK